VSRGREPVGGRPESANRAPWHLGKIVYLSAGYKKRGLTKSGAVDLQGIQRGRTRLEELQSNFLLDRIQSSGIDDLNWPSSLEKSMFRSHCCRELTPATLDGVLRSSCESVRTVSDSQLLQWFETKQGREGKFCDRWYTHLLEGRKQGKPF